MGSGVQTGEAELLEELWRRAEERRSSDGGGAPDLDHEAMLEETSQRAVAIDAADELDLRAGNRLAIGDDGERLQRGGGQLDLCGQSQQRGDEPRILWRRDELRCVAEELDAQTTSLRLTFRRQRARCLA